MKKSISRKMFGAILFGFISLIVVLIIGLNIYFVNFYEQSKINSLIDAVNQFENEYYSNKWTSDELYRQAELFSAKHNATLSIVKDESNEVDEGESESESEQKEEKHDEEISKYVLLTTVDNKSRYYDLFVPAENFYKMNIKQGDDILLKGVIEKNDVILPTKINEFIINSNTSYESYKEVTINVQIVSAKENLTLPDRGKSEFAVLESNVNKGVEYVISEIPHTDIRQVELSKSIELNNNEMTLYVLASLQPIKETINFLTSFYPYIIVFALIVSLIIALIHSTWVSRPILKINSAANKMANLNFDIRLEENRKDELGQLAKSLNSMSHKLETTITELRDAKEKIQKDYDIELLRQKIQKEFVANASHELKAPLGVIKGYSEGIKDGVDKQRLEEYIETIIDESEKMDNLIKKMLEISKLDLLGNQLNKVSVDFEIIVLNIIQNFEHALLSNELLIDISGEFGTIKCDEDMMYSAVQNLISNAVKYAKNNSVIKIRSIIKDNQRCFEIQNECVPFTNEEKIRVWEKFYKTDVSHNRQIEGTGLGLAIVKSILETHKMKFGVYNCDNGVVFWFVY